MFITAGQAGKKELMKDTMTGNFPYKTRIALIGEDNQGNIFYKIIRSF